MDFLNNEVGNNDPEPGAIKYRPTGRNLKAFFESCPGIVENEHAVGCEDSESLSSVEEVLGHEQHSEEVVGDPVLSEQHSEEVVVDPVLSEQHSEKVVVDPVQSEQHSGTVVVDPVQSEQHSEKVVCDPVQSEQHSEKVVGDPVQSEQQSEEVVGDPVQSEQQSEEVVGDQSEQPLQGQHLHTLQGLHRALQSLKHTQQGNRIAQPIEVSQFHASHGNSAGTEIADFLFSKVLYNVQLLRDQEYPFSVRAYADAMWLMDMHMKTNECVPMVLMRLYYKPADRLNEWLELDLFCQHLAKFLYLHSKGRGLEMKAFPIYPIYKEDLAYFFRLYPCYT